MVLLVLKSHGALHFGGCVDERAQKIAGQRMVVAAGVDVLELAGLVVMALSVGSLEQETLDFISGVQGVALFVVKPGRETLQHTPDVARVRGAILVDDFPEDQDFAATEEVGGRPVESRPVDAEAKVAFALRSEAA